MFEAVTMQMQWLRLVVVVIVNGGGDEVPSRSGEWERAAKGARWTVNDGLFFI